MSKKRPLLLIPPQYSSFEDMFNSQEFKDFMTSNEANNIRIDDHINKQAGISIDQEYTILVGHCNEPTVLEQFILQHGGQKIS